MDYLLLTADNRHIRGHGHIVARPFGWVKGGGVVHLPHHQCASRRWRLLLNHFQQGQRGVCGRPSPRSQS
ncbi:MAG: hypothetical protein OT477_06365 [Chloroflexi bacterium]|nr:hypothetical protein [Chloroflexota bacterium]